MKKYLILISLFFLISLGFFIKPSSVLADPIHALLSHSSVKSTSVSFWAMGLDQLYSPTGTGIQVEFEAYKIGVANSDKKTIKASVDDKGYARATITGLTPNTDYGAFLTILTAQPYINAQDSFHTPAASTSSGTGTGSGTGSGSATSTGSGTGSGTGTGTGAGSSGTISTNNNSTTTTETGGDLTQKGGGLIPDCPAEGCGWDQFMLLIKKVIDFAIFGLSLPVGAIVIAWTGFLFMTSGDDPGKRKKAKDALIKIVAGLVIAMAAWLIVNTILTSLIRHEVLKNYSLLK